MVIEVCLGDDYLVKKKIGYWSLLGWWLFSEEKIGYWSIVCLRLLYDRAYAYGLFMKN